MSCQSGALVTVDPAFVVGDRVRCERAGSARGSWLRYAGKVGTVVSVNVSRSVNGSPDVVEVGVVFGSVHNHDRRVIWFRSDELVIVDAGDQAASGRLLAANAPNGDSAPTAQVTS